MKKIAATAALMLAAGPALAHTGHVVEAAGHSHWLGLGALALAAIVAVPLVIRFASRRPAAPSRNG